MKSIFTCCLCLCGLITLAQPKESFYALDSSWQQTGEQSAKYLLWIHLDPAGNWAYSYYHMRGPIIKMQTYKDHEGTVLSGLSCYYYSTGNLDSVAHYKDGKKDGIFLRYKFLPNDTLRLAARYDYVLDSLTGVAHYSHDSSGSDGQTMPGDKAPEYSTGAEGWQSFLKQNLRYPEHATTQGTVRIVFGVDGQGNVLEPVVSKSVEYALDREALRIIGISGKWTPGLTQGVPATRTSVQPVVFRLE